MGGYPPTVAHGPVDDLQTRTLDESHDRPVRPDPRHFFPSSHSVPSSQLS